jgi:hypothetical protein
VKRGAREKIEDGEECQMTPELPRLPGISTCRTNVGPLHRQAHLIVDDVWPGVARGTHGELVRAGLRGIEDVHVLQPPRKITGTDGRRGARSTRALEQPSGSRTWVAL